ncbi:MAG TPA: hypothetical protein VI248_10925, partial [Kineosporiaceae bacterium]
RQLRRVRQTRAPRRSRRWLAAAGATGAAVATLVAVLLPPAPPAPRPAAAAVRVDPAGITASASSTSRPDGAVTYVAENTLDGDPSTAWNSAGGLHPGSGGIALTYTFGHPVDLRSIVVLNGYQKVRRRSGHSPVDLYPANARVRWVRIVTDAGRWTWELADRRAPQSFTAATGRTGSVRLDVMSTYPSTTYPDIALSEVSFTAALSG